MEDSANLFDTIAGLHPDTSYSWDDKGLSAVFAGVFMNQCRYNTTAKEWFVFNGRYWEPDPGAMRVSQLVKSFTDALLAYTVTIPDEGQRAKYLKAISPYGMNKRREILIRDARDVHFFAQSDLDADLNLFNCQNGTLNLTTGKFYAHEPGDMLARVSNVIYDPAAKSPLFEQFISDIMEGNQDKTLYLQKVLGIALTANTSLETCWLLYGPSTRNGKSTLVETMSFMMGNTGGYALSMQPQTLAQKQSKDTRQASGDIARLDGCRFLNASEPPKRMLFDTALLKTLLGRDTITARHLYEREFEFTPRFHLFINTNYLPLITDDTLFSSGRINVIRFDRHFSPDEQDATLKDKLRTPENISGIFNWCLQGLRAFREEGATPPASVRAATDEYRQSSDKFGNFMAECLVKSSRNCAASAAYQRYHTWCEDNGFGTENKRSFFDELKSKGLLANSGTVDGLTVHNVICGYQLTS